MISIVRRSLRRVFVLHCLTAMCLQTLPVSASQGSLNTRELSAMQTAYRAAGLEGEAAVDVVLRRFTFGAQPGERSQVLASGLPTWFSGQLDAAFADTPLETRLQALDALAVSDDELMAVHPSFSALAAHIRRYYPGVLPPADQPVVDFSEVSAKLAAFAGEHGLRRIEDSLLPQVEAQKLLHARYSRNQLREVMVDFWANHFYASTANFGSRAWVLSFEQNVLRPHALGSFEALLQATLKHPAMLEYYGFDAEPSTLAVGQSLMALRTDSEHKPKPVVVGEAAPSVADAQATLAIIDRERDLILRREFWPNTGPNLALARSLLTLHTLGPGADVKDQDIRAAARVLTGWTVFPQGADARWFAVDSSRLEPLGFVHRGSFWFRADQHDPGVKTLLGVTYADGDGLQEGEDMLRMLAEHPDTARHIAGKLVRHFAGAHADDELVQKLAGVFLDTGGDIRALLATLVSEPAFWRAAAAADAVKPPFRLVVSALRHTGAEVGEGAALASWLARLGQPLYAFKDPSGYPSDGSYWLDQGAVINRFRFARALMTGEIDGVRLPRGKASVESLAGPGFQYF